jgi:exonuclease III
LPAAFPRARATTPQLLLFLVVVCVSFCPALFALLSVLVVFVVPLFFMFAQKYRFAPDKVSSVFAFFLPMLFSSFSLSTQSLVSSPRVITDQKCSNRTTTVAVFNPRSIKHIARIDALCAYAHLHCIDLLVIPETRRSQYQQPPATTGGFLYVEELGNDRGLHGVGILIHPKLKATYRYHKSLHTNRAVLCVFERFTFIAVYMHTFVQLQERDILFDELTAAVQSIHRFRPLIVAGDFNSRPDPNNIDSPDIRLKRAAEQFQEFLQGNDLTCANINFPGKGTPKTHTFGTLDYICTRSSARSCIRDIKIRDGPFRSDHKFLSATLKIHTAATTSKRGVEKKDTYLLTYNRYPVWQRAFVSAFFSFAPPLLDSATITYQDFCCRVQAGMEILPVASKKPKLQSHWKNDAVKKTLLALNDVVPTEETDENLLKTLKKARIEDVSNLVNQYASQLEKHPRKAWEFIRCMKSSVTSKLPAASNAERTQKFFDQFSSLYKAGPIDPTPELPEPLFPQFLVYSTDNFSLEEVAFAVNTLKNYKAPGLDGVQNEVLKLSGLLEPLTHLLNKMLHGEIEQEQRNSVLVPLPKKGDLSNTSNWRGISLMSHVTKLFDKLLMIRLRTVIDTHLQYAQNGFREARGCLQHIFALSILRDISQQQHYFVHLCYVDFSKAFDSVTWTAIQRELRFWHVPLILVDAIFQVMVNHTLQVRCDGELSASFSVELGVLQGDTLAPYLFVIVMDSILRRLDQNLGVEIGPREKRLTKRQQCMRQFSTVQKQKKLCALAFADDVVLLAPDLHSLQGLFVSFQTFALELGLKINLGKGKTERMYFGPILPPGDLLTLNNQIVPVVDKYKYLGTHLTTFESDWGIKKGKAWAILNTFQSIWDSRVNWEYKRRLFRSLIEPIFTYGLCAWPLTAARTARINATFGRMLRKALGLPSVKVSYKNHNFVHTEELYKDCPFLSTSVRKQRTRMVLKALKEHNEGIRTHPFIDVLYFELGEDKKKNFKAKRGPRISLSSSLLHDLEIDPQVEPLVTLELCTEDIEAHCELVAELSQKEYWATIKRRRELQAARTQD